MQSAIRHHLAAALILLPAAGAIVAQPAQAQQRAIVAPPAAAAPAALPAPVIERFVVRPHGRIVAGRELRFRVVGAPRAEAWVSIPGVVRRIGLEETRAGVYQGSYTVRRRDDPAAFHHAIATLRRGHLQATAQAELGGAGPVADNRAPRIFDLAPGSGARVDEYRRTHVRARLSDEGSGVDPASVRLVIDGLDVTRNAHVSTEEVGYREKLGRGRHSAELVVRDRAGNENRTAWTFRVV